jgi:hypothetical protein
MSFVVTRRTAIARGLALASTSSLLVACGGGGDDTGGGDPGGGGGGGGSGGSGTLSGALWYHDSAEGNLYVVDAGTAAPRVATKSADEANTLFEFQVSRKGPRYLNLGHVGSGSSASTRAYCLNHADHSSYCFINVVSYVSTALVSPSGNYVAMLRSPELFNALYGSDPIVGITMVEIGDPSNIRDNRSDFASGNDAVLSFRWIDDSSSDDFIYITVGGSIVRGSAAAGAAGDEVMGTIDKQGLVMTSNEFQDNSLDVMDISPDGTQMVLTLINGELVPAADNWWDLFVYDMTGKQVGRLTETKSAYGPLWSPDGRDIFFKDGHPTVNNTFGKTNSPHVAAASSRSLPLDSATSLDTAKVPTGWDVFWSANR